MSNPTDGTGDAGQVPLLRELTQEATLACVRAGFAGLSAADYAELGSLLYSRVELAVGEEIMAGLTERQIAQWDLLSEAGDEPGQSALLQQVRPDYPQVVAWQRQRVIAELRTSLATASAEEAGI